MFFYARWCYGVFNKRIISYKLQCCNLIIFFLRFGSHRQLEEDLSETQRLLVQERSARTLQENLFNSHLRKQQEMEEENKRNVSMSNEVKSGRHFYLV